MRIISVTNQKGGCGKTTTAINLSASLAANGKKVLLIDLDPQSHATLGMNLKADLSIYNVLSKLTSKKANLENIIQPIGPNFDIAPSSIVLSTLEQELSGEIGRESRLWEKIRDFKGNYDYIIIDCPPNLGILTINAIRATEEIIIPVEASRFALEGVSQLTEIIHLIGDRLNHKVIYRVLVTNFDSRLRHSFRLLDYIRKTFKDRLFSTIIHVNVKLKEAQTQGTHILNYDKYCRGTKDYFSLSREIITQERTYHIPAAVAMPQQVKSTVQQAQHMEKQMKEILKEKLPRFTEIVFFIMAPEAKNVFLAGDFNNWHADSNSRMEKSTDGMWKKKINLGQGRYHYRFVVDDRWLEDPNNPTKEINPYGDMDSIIEVTPAVSTVV